MRANRWALISVALLVGAPATWAQDEDFRPTPPVEQYQPAPEDEDNPPAPKSEQSRPAPQSEQSRPAPQSEQYRPAPQSEQYRSTPSDEPRRANPGHPGAVDVELWTDQGNDAVYQPGDPMKVSVRSSDDGYLMVYEIDTEGYVRLLWPTQGSRGFIDGRQTLEFPSPESNLELVVEPETGQGYIVAIVSNEPFRNMPWYLRPYDMQAEELGYEGEIKEEDGVTRAGQIVGDPFVAMERIRRAVLSQPEDEGAFGTAYTSYYVHERVKYPRYLCNDCHRPEHWAWWDGWDPYYTTCSAFTFRVNWGWYWGPGYWFGSVPYYYYVVRNDCPPRYQMWASHGCYSSWNGWTTWQQVMGTSTTRYKSPPPAGYTPPDKFGDGSGGSGGRPAPGLMTGRQVAIGRQTRTGGLRPTSGGTLTSLFRESGERRTRDVVRGRLGDGTRTRDGETRGGISRDPEAGLQRPRDVARGGMRSNWRTQGDNREPTRTFRGKGDRSEEGGIRWVGRGQARRESEGRPSFRSLVERGRIDMGSREAPPRSEARFERRPERPQEASRSESRALQPSHGGDRATVGRSSSGHGGGNGGNNGNGYGRVSGGGGGGGNRGGGGGGGRSGGRR